MNSLTIKKGKFPPLTASQISMLDALKDRPINYEDIPPLTDEQLIRMRRISNDKQIAV